MNITARVFLLCVLCTSLANSTSVTGIGGNFPWPVYADWIYAYSLTHPDANITYSPTTTQNTVKNIVSPTPAADFFSTNALLHRDDSELVGKQDSLQLIPFVIGSLIPIYNIPSLVYADGSGRFARLVLSTDVLADIFRGRIQYWNDSRIQDDNPELVLPEGPITRVLRRDSSGFTYVFSSALSLFVNDWEYSPNTTWPKAIQQLPNTVLSFDNFGMIADINKNVNSIGYISLAQLVTQRIAITTSYAHLKNKQGNVVGPTEEYVVAAQNNVTFDKYLFQSFLNSKDPNVKKFLKSFINSKAWPIALAAFIAIRTDITRDCNKDRELYRFIYWTKTDPAAIARLSDQGYSRWSDHLREQIIDYLLNATCDNNKLLTYTIVNYKTAESATFFLALGMVLLGVSMILGLSWHYLNQSRCSKVVVLYQLILLLGIALTYVSVIFWYFEPSSDNICKMRVWSTTLGYSLILTAMFERTWQIRRVYGKVVKGNQLTTTVTNFFEIGGGIFLIMCIQIIILIIWTVTDPYSSVLIQTGHWEGEYGCQSSNPTVWLAVESVYFGLLLIWAIVVVYTTWSIRTFIVESRWILIAMYNVMLFLALLATLFATVEMDDFDLYFIMAPFIELATTTIVIAVYAPSVLKELKLIVSTDSLSGRSKSSMKTDEERSKAEAVKKSVSEEKGDIELN